MTRKVFLALGVPLLILGGLAYVALSELIAWSQGLSMFSAQAATSLMVARIEGMAGLIIVALLAAPAVGLIVKRLHDFDASGWWLAALAAPEIANSMALATGAAGIIGSPTRIGSVLAVAAVIGAVALLPVALWPGTTGPNRFGPEPAA